MEKNDFLQHAENCVHTSVFARHLPKYTVNSVSFCYQGNNFVNTVVFWLPRCKKMYFCWFLLWDSHKTWNTTYLTIFGHETEKNCRGNNHHNHNNNKKKEQGTRNKEQGTRNQEPGTRNKEQGARNKETRNREQGTRNKEQRTRNKEQGTRNQTKTGPLFLHIPLFCL